MRLIATLHNSQRAQGFSSFLTQEGIANNLDTITSESGEIVYQIWILEEDELERAHKMLEQLEADPDNPRFRTASALPPPQPPPIPKELRQPQKKRTQIKFRPRAPTRSQSQLGFITGTLLLLCLVLFTWSLAAIIPPEGQAPSDKPTGLQLMTNPVGQKLLFDYPEKVRLRDELFTRYDTRWVERPTSLPAEGRALFLRYNHTPQWTGAYDEVLKQKRIPFEVTTPIFEKIREGEVWRLVTPAFLHWHFWHILFNMMWLLILGSQIEKRLGWFRYILFILLAASGSCTAQYLMGGYNFVGYSGVITAMIGFIWIRQKRAAWEGYFLHPNTILLIAIFVIGLALLQIYSFLVEWQTGETVPSVIANTAHVSGGLIGIFLGRLPFFAWRQGR